MAVKITKCMNTCVWMDAGVITYKCCDRDYDCEHCALDKGLRETLPSVHPEKPPAKVVTLSVDLPKNVRDHEAELLRKYQNVLFHPEFSYMDPHLWVRVLDETSFIVGLDGLWSSLLPEKTELITVAGHTERRPGDAFCWVYSDGEPTKLSLPVEATFRSRVTDLADNLFAIRTNPYELGWLFTASKEDILELESMLIPANRYTSTLTDTVEDFITEAYHKLSTSPELGILLNDGGEPVSSLAQALGAETYRQLCLRALL